MHREGMDLGGPFVGAGMCECVSYPIDPMMTGPEAILIPPRARSGYTLLNRQFNKIKVQEFILN